MRNIHIPTLAAFTVGFTKILVILLVNFSSLINIAYIITINILLLLSLFVSYHTNLLIVKRVWVCSFLFLFFYENFYATPAPYFWWHSCKLCASYARLMAVFARDMKNYIHQGFFLKQVRLFYLRDRLSAVKIQEI